MSTVLVTGAAGDLGRRVVALLSALPRIDRVVAVDLARMEATNPVVETHVFDLSSDGSQDELAGLGKQADSMVHLAWQPEGRDNLRALKNVLDAADAVEPAHFVHLSSATVYGAWADNPVPITEEAQPRPNAELAYAVEKRRAEEMVGRWAEDHPQVAVGVLRPACTVGSASHPLYQALAYTKRRPMGADGRMVQYLHVDDLAKAVVHVLEEGLSGVYNVASDAGILEGTAGRLIGGPASFLFPRSGTMPGSPRWRSLYRGALDGAGAYLDHSWVVSGDKLSQTGWRAEYSSEQALVVADKRGHWDDLPQGRRVALVLSGTAAVLGAVGAAGAIWWRRRA
ncbi:MAG TPA: NAD-dependent epimerase/dehydratase family protein [Acidimicrobiales bacterium]|nr:NAD-dependent epimerase/dehydratase family protein [Acidimicrobiales bacterium]